MELRGVFGLQMELRMVLGLKEMKDKKLFDLFKRLFVL